MANRKHIAPGSKIGLKLSATERKVLLEDLLFLDTEFAETIRNASTEQPVQFSLDDWDHFCDYLAAEANHTQDKRLEKKIDALSNKVQKILDTYTDAESSKTIKTDKGVKKAKPSSETVFQFKITLRESHPPIWRRIQVKDCSLDELHEHIQLAMGWTNSHLHQFIVGDVRYGDAEMLDDGWNDEQEIIDSQKTKISQIIPNIGKRFRFDYEYDFGDGWEHEILFEGRLQRETGTRYPLCVEGERACPPEDIGGIYGYVDYLEALNDPKHERHEEFMEWQGPFDPEAFNTQAATKEMRKGLPNWREME